ncbi:MAG: protein phosphatase 2C domain-containing protein [Candidatus Schekmanbacteria bacterium]|nr:protein phosphatase 2C domain-containing protein [Candidatus Schekmanbacteria bacterium]
MVSRYVFSGAVGSTTGRAHVRCYRPNQDGGGIGGEGATRVAVVTDGCSSGRCSEVGARLGAAWLATHLPRYLGGADGVGADLDVALRAATAELVTVLAAVARMLAREPSDLVQVTRDYLLFTFLVAAVWADRAAIFGIGDGVFSVDGDTVVLDAGPENAPAYVAYRCLPPEAVAPSMREVAPVVWYLGDRNSVQSLLVATDGAAEMRARAGAVLADGGVAGCLEQFATDDRYVRNPSLLQKRLNVLGGSNRLLADDTTIAILRRREVGTCL